MRSLLAVAFAVAFAGAAQALPVSSLPDTSNVIKVAGGCGPGWHRGPHGGCLRNYRHPAYHRCPRGFHVGPGGRCRANY
jgi:hypothetical protein